MAVTTSVFPNLNTFMLGPEFCILYRKLVGFQPSPHLFTPIKNLCSSSFQLSTCETFKKVTLEERYTGICALLQKRRSNVCKNDSTDHQEYYISPRQHGDQDDILNDHELVNISHSQHFSKIVFASIKHLLLDATLVYSRVRAFMYYTNNVLVFVQHFSYP